MKSYKVTITETLQREVEVKAASRGEAAEIAEQNWKNSDYILDESHFVGATFKAERPQKDRGFDR